jgi:hypothetical protein
MRSLSVIALVVTAAVLSACGDDATSASPPGSPDNPLAAQPARQSKNGRSNEANAAAGQSLGYRKLLQRQSSKPKTRFTPCALVTRAQATSILGVAVQAPLEAPQGPTCIYRSKSGSRFVTIAVQPVDFKQVTKQIRRRQAVDVADRRAYCGLQGQPMLYVSLSRGRVLSVAAPCAVARRFATLGVARLTG